MTDQMPPTLPAKVRKELIGRHAGPSPLWREPVFWMVGALVVVALAVMAGWVTWKLNNAADQANAACVRGDKRGPCIAAAQNQAGLAQANQKLSSAGLPTVKPSSQVPAPTVTVTVAPQPPSQASVELAVAAYCQRTACGTGPTAAQVAQAVATYCTVNGHCRGPAGPSGSSVTGPPGQSGPSGSTVTGPPGPAGNDGQNATSDQVAQAVASYCADHDQCQGPPGHDGADGRDGQPPVSWTYTDPLGEQHTCVRTDPFDPSAPTYTCS